MDERELDAREEAHLRRRDRRMGAARRALLRTGTAKVFHQILQHQAKDAAALKGGRPTRTGRRDATSSSTDEAGDRA